MKLRGKAKELDDLHREYESLLIREIESMIGLAVVHGWKSSLHNEGIRMRRDLRKAGSEIPGEPS